MRIFLGLGHAQLRAAGLGDDLAQDVRQASAAGRSSAAARPARSLYCVMPAAAAIRTRAPARKAGECRIEQRCQNLAHAVGAEVEAQHAVAVAHAAIVADHGRQHELVGDVVRIGVRDRPRGASAKRGALGLGDRLHRPWRRAPSACRDPSRSSGR